MAGEGEQVAWRAAADLNVPKARWSDRAPAFGLGILSFAGWLGALALDTKVFNHNAVGSFLAHLPLMLLPAALALAIGLPRLPDNERKPWQLLSARALVILLTVPALLPNLNHHPLWLPLRLPIYGLGLALALANANPGLRVGLDQQRPRRLSPAAVAGIAFGVCAVTTVMVMLWYPQPPATCHGMSCGALAGLAASILCGGALWTAISAVLGAALGYRVGEVMRTWWRTSARAR